MAEDFAKRRMAMDLEDATRSKDAAFPRIWENASGKKVQQMASRGTVNRVESIGASASKPDATGEGRHVFADWAVKDDQLHMNFHFDTTTTTSMNFSVKSPVSDIAAVVAAQLEAGAIKPVHARAVFEALAQHHSREAHKAFADMGDDLERVIARINPDKSYQTDGSLGGKESITKMMHASKNASPHLEAAVEAIKYEEMTIGLTDTKAVAAKISGAGGRDRQ